MMGPYNAEIAGDYIQLLGLIRHPERLYLRHDVDHDILKAFEMAMLESEHGIKSTYYLLPTAPYFDYSDRFVEEVEGLAQLGHMIGLHNNALTEHIRDSKPLTRCISDPLDFLRKCVGTVDMTASHGDKYIKQKKLINYQMWKESPRPWDGPTLSLKSYGLKEAYFVPRAVYLSDSGGKWRGGPMKGIVFEDGFDPCSPIEIIQNFNRLDEGILHLLIHPYWWS
jgi:hypothetical protein